MIYDKANGDVTRLEWVGEAFNDDASFRKSVKLKQKWQYWFSLDRPAQSSWEKIKFLKTQVMAKTL